MHQVVHALLVLQATGVMEQLSVCHAQKVLVECHAYNAMLKMENAFNAHLGLACHSHQEHALNAQTIHIVMVLQHVLQALLIACPVITQMERASLVLLHMVLLMESAYSVPRIHSVKEQHHA